MYIHNYLYMYVSVGPPSSFGPNLLSPSETLSMYMYIYIYMHIFMCIYVCLHVYL